MHPHVRIRREYLTIMLAGLTIASATIVAVRLRAQGTDTTMPVISGVSTVNVTPDSAIIVWTTDEPTDAQVEYGPQTSPYSSQTYLDTTLSTSHAVSLHTSLSPSTTYVYRVKSKDAAGNLAIIGDKTFTTTAAADAPPTISLSLQPTVPPTWRPGGRGYYSWSVSDDKGIQNVVITTSTTTNNQNTPQQQTQCNGKIFCEEKVYVVIWKNPGENFVTVTATDSSGQTVTKTTTAQVVACTTDADCGTEIQWGGATYCGPYTSFQNKIMRGAVVPTCVAGSCDTSTKDLVKQDCGSGQACTYTRTGDNTACVAQPPACTVGAQITTPCTCGNLTYNPPNDWRLNYPTKCCRRYDGVLHTSDNCQLEASPPTTVISPQCPIGVTITSNCTCGGTNLQNQDPLMCCRVNGSQLAVNRTNSCPAGTGSSAILTPAGTTPAVSVSGGSSGGGGGSAVPVMTGVPVIVPTLHTIALPTAATKPAESAAQQTSAPKLRASQIRTLTMRKKVILRQIDALTRTAKRQGHAEALAELQEMHAEASGFTPVYRSDYENITDWTDELGAVQAELRLSAKPAVLKKGVRSK